MAEPVTREAFVQELTRIDPEALRALLIVTEHGTNGAETAEALAERVATCLWWSWSTPLGYLARRAALDEIVDDLAEKMEMEDALEGAEGAWERLDRLQRRVLARVEPAALEDLDPEIREKLGGPSWFPSLFGAGSAGGAYGAGRLGVWVVRLGAGPVGRLLPLIPQLAPYWRAIRSAAAIAAAAGTPVAVGLGVLSLNHALGTNYRRAAPLLLGVGALRASQRGPR